MSFAFNCVFETRGLGAFPQLPDLKDGACLMRLRTGKSRLWTKN
jgi:hypothetical protein